MSTSDFAARRSAFRIHERGCFVIPNPWDLGVRRVSVGSTLSRAAWTGFIRAARALASEGSFTGFDGLTSFAEINEFFREDLKNR